MYSAQEELDVATSDDVRVGQSATSQYMVHQFKSFVGQRTYADLKAELRSTLVGTSATIYLQIYNRTTSIWDTLDSNSFVAASTDFTFRYSLSSLTNYKDSRNVISVRVYQLADSSSQTLSVDLYEVCFSLVYTSKYSAQSNTYIDKYSKVCVSDD